MAEKPIGYWLKHLHELLEEHFEAALAGQGLSRRQWQTLNVVEAGPRSREALRAELAPFWSGDEAVTLDDVLDGPGGLAGRGWVHAGGGTLSLTPAGQAGRAEAARCVARTREVVLGGLGPEQYAETVRVLSVMAANVEADLSRLRSS